MLHVAVAYETIASEQFPGDLLGPLYHQADMIRTPLDLGSEFAHVPEGLGLGVELDEQQLVRWRAD